MREAIHKLVLEGLVIAYPQWRTIVSRIDLEHARQTQFLRRSVEIEVARAAACATAVGPKAPAHGSLTETGA